MSTSFETRRAFGFPVLAAAVLTLGACGFAWSGSTSAGGGHEAQAEKILDEVAKNTRMTSMCRSIGIGIAVSGVRHKVAGRRPTAPLWAAREQRAVDAWDAASCPVPALAAIAYGVAEVANADERLRMAGNGR